MRILSIICAGLLAAAPAFAQSDTQGLGTGRLFTNDYFGDRQDRWRTGSYVLSHVRGPDWQGQRPDGLGAILEYRLRSDIIAPERLNGPQSNDRAYVGALSFGVHSHAATSGYDISLGADLVIVGPQTGLSGLQQSIHERVDAPNLGGNVVDGQVGDRMYLNVVAEAARPVAMAGGAMVRPFAELTAGPETLARVGADVMVGEMLFNDLWLRDSTTGQLYRGTRGNDAGVGFVAGFDVAQVMATDYLPSSGPGAAKDQRWRARVGVHYAQSPNADIFYGLTYLSEEFEGQPEGQVLGSLTLNFNW